MAREGNAKNRIAGVICFLLRFRRWAQENGMDEAEVDSDELVDRR